MIEVRNIQIRCEKTIETVAKSAKFVRIHTISGVFEFETESDFRDFKETILNAFGIGYEKVIFQAKKFLV